MPKKVSIIVPVFNSEKYLEACINSVLRQSYNEIELILVNDGSSDNSLEICNHYKSKDSRIIVVSQNNQGVSSARNTGIEHSSGDYITFLDSDDELKKNAVEFLVKDLIEYGADMASAVKSLIDANGVSHCSYDDNKVYVYEDYEAIKRSLLYDRQTNSACAKLFTKELISDVRFINGRSINEDGYFLFECYAKQPKVVQHNVSIYNYYVRKNSNSRCDFSEKFFDMLFFSDLKMKYIREKVPDLIELAKDMEVSTHLFFLEALCKTTDPKYKKAERNSISIVRKRNFKYHSINRHEKKMAMIVIFGLYSIYKAAVRRKYYRK